MKISFISIGTAFGLALLAAGYPASTRAADGLAFVSSQDRAVADEVQDIKEQVSKGLAAFDLGDYQKAFRLLSSASVMGGPEVHYRLGRMYAEGLGVPKNPNRAAYWLRLAAKQNHAGASEALSVLRQSGQAS